ncbi:MAG: glutamyl-tRNA reductase [Planctomycetes bacterium]|nr:glutamyl-tRNA reductase [Planctomycetota bacterium]MCW8134744.1 glutamyl-tRNA reductase [Planctomycetota bacterium]
MQRYVVLGVNHKFAPLEVRERLAYPERKLPGALKQLREGLPCDEAVLLSTCNRVEVYAFADAADARDRLIAALAADHGMKPDYLESLCYFHRGRDAVEHVLRVCGGLDSLVLGETQILSQVKRAYLLAQSEGATGKQLNGLFHKAFHVAKRLHSETAIGQGQVSISSVAVRFVRRIFDDLGSKTALLIGAGEVGELTLTYLREAGIGRVVVVSRSLERAKEIAERYKGDAVPVNLLEDYLPAADVVITQTAAEDRILSKAQFAKSQRARGYAPVFVLDLAVPRDVEEAAAELDGVFLYNVDDLEQVVAENAEERSRELDKCAAIVRSEADEFLAGFQTYAAAPLITELREKAIAVKNAELDRVFAKYPEMPEDQRRELAAFSERLVNKLLHPQIQGIKDQAARGDTESIRRLALALGIDKAVPPAPPSPQEEAARKTGD